MNRRNFVRTLAAAPLVLGALESSNAADAEDVRRVLEKPKVRDVVVTGIEVFRVKVNSRGNWVLARVKTSDGVTGVGDASHGGSDGSKLKYLKQFGDILKGRSVFDIEGLRLAAEPTIFAGGGSAAAICLSALEQSLWDIQGKLFGVPAYQLFGGHLNKRIRNYANINRSTEDRTPQGFALAAERAVKAGFDAVKLAPFDSITNKPPISPEHLQELIDIGVECARAVRQAIGDKVDLILDVHSRVNLEQGIALTKRLEPLNLFWLEEVVAAKPSLDGLAEINRVAKMPTAGGESIYGVRGFLPYINAKAVDIVMPDVKYVGGMLELKKIGALAEAADLPVSPHGPASPIGNLAAAHVCCSMPNFNILEFSYGEVPWRAELVSPPEEVVKGYITPSPRPGLGVELNDKTVAKYKAEGGLDAPQGGG